MIDTTKEQLIPVRQVPGYLERRGFGKRMHIGAVYRWIHRGLDGVRLESVRIGGTTVTSAEAIQRWAAAREQMREQPCAVPTPPRVVALQKRREDTRRRLEEFRVLPTMLDRSIRALDAGEATTREHVANVLFHAGMRSLADVQAKTVDQLLAMTGIGPKSAPVIRALANLGDHAAE